MAQCTVPTVRRTFGVFALLFVVSLPGTASAQWLQDGIQWRTWPNASRAGDCFGNCGAGCSDSPNGGCSGGQQYWELSFPSGPNYVQSGRDYECDSSYGNMWTRTWDQYTATGTWTYHGWVMPGCITHDVTCNQFLVGCLAFLGCGSPGWNYTWSYSDSITGYAYGGWDYFGSC
jgi:hypothetical protein